ncbi:hypothetical protein ACTMTI_17840 [Nonomuraea sp. H19]|uniref:hypothetical protein n=1 Tax=Nonomuraea sp. H19 TaxID=3452206 RepID=UPI003F8AB25C
MTPAGPPVTSPAAGPAPARPAPALPAPALPAATSAGSAAPAVSAAGLGGGSTDGEPVGGESAREAPGAGAWEAVVAAIDSGDPERVAECVLALDDHGRRVVAAALPEHLAVAGKRAEARRLERVTRRERQPSRDESWIDPMRVAGAGVISGPAAVVAWLNRRDFQDRRQEAGDITAVLERVLAARPPTWQADFATRAALGLRARTWGRRAADAGALALAMLRRSRVTPPEHDPLVVAWVSRPPTAAALHDDPLLDHLLPRLFEAEGVGRALRDERAEPLAPATWLASLTALERAGRIGRDLLLDGCVRRFLRGGPAADLRFFVRLHELLAPAYDEASKRARDYLRLLPVAPGPVAELALRHVRGAGGLDPAEVSEALRALLFRPERKLVTAGLTWFDEVARASPGDLDELAPALAHAFGCPSADVQGRAVRLAVKYAKRFGHEGALAVREAAGLLSPELGEALVAVFGGEAAEEAGEHDRFTPVPLPEPRRPEPFPPPVRAAAELGEVSHHDGWEAAELWLAGVVRLHAGDRAGLMAKLPEWRPSPEGPWPHVWQWAEEIVRLLRAHPGGQGAARLPLPGSVSALHLFLLRRWAEVRDGLVDGTLPPYLLAEPTESTGHLDAAELVERLEGYERSGAAAMPADLQQALLRLSREITPEVVARAGRLTSEAGRVAARWMGGGRPEPVSGASWSYGGTTLYLVPRIQSEPTGLALVDELLVAPGRQPGEQHGGYLEWWPYVMPSHREVVALHFLPHLLYHWSAGRVRPPQARALALAGGPAGEAVAVVQAYFAADRSWTRTPDERARLVVDWAARGDLDAARFGRQLALLLRRTWLKPGPVFETLEGAAALGAHREVWRVMTEFLAGYLPDPGERPHPRHTQALAFALRAARWAGARGPVPCVAGIAARKASNNFVREARRLHTYLT